MFYTPSIHFKFKFIADQVWFLLKILMLGMNAFQKKWISRTSYFSKNKAWKFFFLNRESSIDASNDNRS